MDLLPFDPATPLLGAYSQRPKTPVQKNICTPTFLAASFTIATIWSSPRAASSVDYKAVVHPHGAHTALRRDSGAALSGTSCTQTHRVRMAWAHWSHRGRLLEDCQTASPDVTLTWTMRWVPDTLASLPRCPNPLHHKLPHVLFADLLFSSPFPTASLLCSSGVLVCVVCGHSC